MRRSRDVTGPAAREVWTTVPRRVALLIVAARGGFRVAGQIGPLVLIPVWGGTTFAHYANAIGVCTAAIYVSAGAEKALLKLLPRSRRLTGFLVRSTLLVATVPLLLVLVALLLVDDRPARLYLAAALWSLTNGVLIVAAALHRLAGRPLRDAVIFLTMTAVSAVLLALTWLLSLSPTELLVSTAATGCVLAVWQLLRLPRSWLRDTPVRRPRRIVLRSVWLLGLADLLGGLSATVAYAALGLSGRTEDSGALYVAMLVAVGFGALITLLLRFAQPGTSVRLRGTGATAGRRRAVRLLRAGTLVGLGSGVAVSAGVLAGLPPIGLLVLVTAFEIPVFALIGLGTNLIENTDGRALSMTTGSAAIGLVAGVVAAAALVPALGAGGALAVVLVSFAARGAALWALLSRRYRARAG